MILRPSSRWKLKPPARSQMSHPRRRPRNCRKRELPMALSEHTCPVAKSFVGVLNCAITCLSLWCYSWVGHWPFPCSARHRRRTRTQTWRPPPPRQWRTMLTSDMRLIMSASGSALVPSGCRPPPAGTKCSCTLASPTGCRMYSPLFPRSAHHSSSHQSPSEISSHEAKRLS